MKRIWAIAANTFREAVRNKILYSLLFFAIILIFSALALGELTLGQGERLTRDLGLYGVDIFGVLIAVFLGVNLLYKELQLKTVYTILPKPLHRWEFVAGKWCGMVFTLALQVSVMGAFVYLTLWLQDAPFELATAKAIWLLLINVIVVTSVALFFSSFSSPFLSGIFSVGIFILGRSVPDLEKVGQRAGGVASILIDGAVALLPNLYLFMPSGAVIGAETISVHSKMVSLQYMAWATLYGLGYSLVALFLAMLIFRRRDFV